MRVRHAFAVSALFCALFNAPAAVAQTATQADGACPMLPSDGGGLYWTALRTVSALLCRAMRNADNREAFALTMTRKVSFRLENDMREEEGEIEGRKVWWHRSEIAGRPNEVVRETLLKLGSDRVAHIYIRSDNAAEVARYQQLVQGLRFQASDLAQR